MKAGLKLSGRYKMELIRNNRVVQFETHNGVVTEGLDTILDTMFNALTQTPEWKIGLIDNTNFSAVDPSDTMASHAGWQEITNYSETDRVDWAPEDAANGVVTNATAVTFTINADGTIKGLFLTSDGSKGGTTGLLWATAIFGTAVPVLDGDSLKVTYTVTATAN